MTQAQYHAPSLFSLTRDYIRHNRRESYMTLGLVAIIVSSLSAGIGLFLSALLYIPLSLWPRKAFHLISSFTWLSSTPETPPYGLYFLVVFVCSASCLFWLALTTAVYTRRIYCPGNARSSRLPLWSLLFLSCGLATLLATGSLFFVMPNIEDASKGIYLIMALFFVVQPILTNVVLFKVPGMVLGQESLFSGQIFSAMQTRNLMSLPRQLWFFNLVFYLLVMASAVAEFGSLYFAETVPGIEWGVSPINLIVWLILSQFLSVASVQAHKLLRPESTLFKPTARSFWPGLAVLVGCSMAIYIGLYSYHMAEFARLEKDWQIHLKARQAHVHRVRPVLRGTALPGNGATIYWSVIGKNKEKSNFTMAEKDKKVLNDAISKINSGAPLPTPEVKYLNKYQPQIQLLQKAAQHSIQDFAPTFKLDEVLPNFISAQDLSKAMTLMAVDKCQQGPCKDGLTLFLDTWRFGQDIGGQGWLISAMVGVVIEQIAVRNFGPYLQPEDLTPAEYQQAFSEIRTLFKSNPHYVYAQLNESQMLMSMALDMVKNDSAAMDMVGEELAGFSLFKWGGYLMMMPQFLDAYRIGAELAAHWQQMASQDYPSIEKKVNSHFNDERWFQSIEQNILTSIAMSNFMGAITRMVNAEATLKGFYQHLALMAYFRQQGHYPERLSQLVPQFIPELPKDPFSGSEFHYKRLADDDFRLYSVGGDFKDDGGKGVYFHTGCDKNADVVFSPSQPKAHCEY